MRRERAGPGGGGVARSGLERGSECGAGCGVSGTGAAGEGSGRPAAAQASRRAGGCSPAFQSVTRLPSVARLVAAEGPLTCFRGWRW